MLYLPHNFGGLAHLARALAWQARGGRFESDILHIKTPQFFEAFLIYYTGVTTLFRSRNQYFTLLTK
jgi:hypothetical protein